MQREFRFAPGDVTDGENPEKVAMALDRFRPEVVADADLFDTAYRLLDAQFGAANEIERREVLDRWFRDGSLSPPGAVVRARYHMLVFRDADGRIAAVRDCFTALDRAANRVVTLMSHSLVLPEWRRSGIGALVRASPVEFSRRHAAEEGLPAPEIVLVSEMEHVVPDDLRSLVRLVAYIRAGMRIVPPWIVPYAQPDFRDVEALGVEAVPLPFMLLVRQVGHERESRIAWDTILAICEAFGAIHGPSVFAGQRPAIVANMLRHRDPTAGATLPLISPDVARFDEIAPLLRSTLAAHYPAAWYADNPPGDPVADREALARAIGSLR